MKFSFRKGLFILGFGDIILFFISLWAALALRLHTLPSGGHYQLLLPSFSLVLILWVIVFLISGLYDRNLSTFSRRIPTLLIRVFIANVFISVAFFYFLNSEVAPKTILLIHTLIYFLLMLAWRGYAHDALFQKKPQSALVVGRGVEVKQIYDMSRAHKYSFVCVDSIDLNTTPTESLKTILKKKIEEHSITLVILDFGDVRASEILAHFYELLFAHITFVRFDRVYEELFQRIPLSILGYHWFLENISFIRKISYDIGKRIMDISIAAILLIVTSPIYPVVAWLIRREDGGNAFIIQDRIGKGGEIIKIPKFRSMKKNDGGVWPDGAGDQMITKIGRFIRKTRIDELPQLWSVIKGDLSLIGPRPDIIDLGKQLVKDIPYYAIRNTVTPGLSGWAQIMQELPPHSLEETKVRLSYDFYYIKNRSLSLDLHIAMRTIKTLLSRVGR